MGNNYSNFGDDAENIESLEWSLDKFLKLSDNLTREILDGGQHQERGQEHIISIAEYLHAVKLITPGQREDIFNGQFEIPESVFFLLESLLSHGYFTQYEQDSRLDDTSSNSLSYVYAWNIYMRLAGDLGKKTIAFPFGKPETLLIEHTPSNKAHQDQNHSGQISQELDAQVKEILDIITLPEDKIIGEASTSLDDFLNYLHRKGEISEDDRINAIGSDNIVLAIKEVLIKKIVNLRSKISQQTYEKLDQWEKDFVPSFSLIQTQTFLGNSKILVDIYDDNAVVFNKFLKLCSHVTRKIKEGATIGSETDFFRGQEYVEKMIDILRSINVISINDKEKIEYLSFEVSILKILDHMIMFGFFDEDIQFLEYVKDIYTGLADITGNDKSDVLNYIEIAIDNFIIGTHGGDLNQGLDHDQIESILTELISHTKNNLLSIPENIEYIGEFISFLQEIKNDDAIGEDFGINLNILAQELYNEEYKFVAHEIIFYVMLNYLDDNFALMEQAYLVMLEYYDDHGDEEKINELRNIIHPYRIIASKD